MRADKQTLVDYVVAELASALLALKDFGAFDNPAAMPRHAKPMSPPISTYAQSFFDTALGRLVQVSSTVYGVSTEGAFLQELVDSYEKWTFPIRKRTLFEKIGLAKWAPNFVQGPTVPKVMGVYAPWNDPAAFGNTVRFQHDIAGIGRLSVFMTEGLTAWRSKEETPAKVATSVYFVMSKSKSK